MKGIMHMNETTNLDHLTPEFLSDVLITAFDGGYGACSYWARSGGQ